MRKGIVSAALATAWLVCSVLYAFSADVVALGGNVGWASIVTRSGVIEAAGLRNFPVLTLSSAGSAPARGEEVDAIVSFDEGDPATFSDSAGKYRVSSTDVAAASSAQARKGNGAALFSGAGGGVTVAPLAGSLAAFGAGSRLGDFSLEFWFYSANLENGERPLSWAAVRSAASGARAFQRIDCQIARNRVEWTFKDFFAAPDDRSLMPITLASKTRLIPRAWSRHEIRFDSGTGLLEYLIDGKLEDSVFVTTTGHEGGEVFPPIAGSGGAFTLGARLTGFIDEFRLRASVPAKPASDASWKYPRGGGRAETRFFDLGTTNAEVLRLDAAVHAAGAAEARFFVRAGNSPYAWKKDEASWVPVSSGEPLEGIRGRWLQLAIVLYPDVDGETAPFVENVKISYLKDDAPPPPSLVTAVAKNGAVELKWRASPDPDLGGYLVYYGDSRGEYFGTDAAAGESPLDVGLRASYVVDGLRDGTLYYFTIAAYDRASPRHVGEFSREVFARPARTAK